MLSAASGRGLLVKGEGDGAARVSAVELDLDRLTGTSDMKKIVDLKGNPLLLFIHEWSVGMTLERNENLKLSAFGGWSEED